jgi:hypothetical protein
MDSFSNIRVNFSQSWRDRKMDFILEPQKRIPVIAKADVVVVGGGPAGVGAALRAARNGASTILIEKFGSLGGFNTTGFMSTVRGESPGRIAAEIFEKMKPGGYVVNLKDHYPDVTSNPLSHWSHVRSPLPELVAFDPDLCAYFITDMAGDERVRLFLDTVFVDASVENGAIRAVVIENVSGRSAIEGQVFIDATGRGEVSARSGVPCGKRRNELGLPTPPGLMWKMSGVDYEKLKEYQKEDPKLEKLIEKAREKGEAPHYWSPKGVTEIKTSDRMYSGHSRPEMCPLAYPGDLLFWMPAEHDLGLNCAENAEELTRAEIVIRRHIVSEMVFLKKYVPGFEQAHLGGIAPVMGIREGRYPIGEYVLTFDDVMSQKKFEDVAIRFRSHGHKGGKFRRVFFEIPCRCFFPKKINNLLLAGDNLSADHGGLFHIRGFGNAVSLGEVAGIMAFVSVKNRKKPKDLEYSKLRKELESEEVLFEVEGRTERFWMPWEETG